MKFYGFLLQWCLLSLGLTANPGIKVRIAEKALIDGQQFGIEFLKQKLKGAIFENWNGQIRYNLIPVSYTVSGLKVDNIEFPISSVFFMPGTGLHILLDLTTSVSLDWKITTWFGISSSGRANITISMDFRAVVRVLQHETGHPSWLLEYCEANITEHNIQLGEEPGFFSSIIAYFLKRFIHYHLNHNALCPYIKEEIQRLNMELIETPALVQIDQFVQIDTSLTESPTFEMDYMDLSLNGTVYPVGNVTKPLFKPDCFILPKVNNSMLYIGVSEYFFQSALQAYYSSGVFNISVTETLSSFVKFKTDTLSNFIPMINKEFPEPHPIILNLVATAPPAVTLHPGYFQLQFAGSMDVLAVTPNSSTQSLLFTLNITATIHAEPTIFKQKLVSVLFLNRFNLTLAHSNVGQIKVLSLESFLSTALQYGVIPRVNDFLKNGFPLPNLDEFILVDSALQVNPNHLVFSTDFKL